MENVNAPASEFGGLLRIIANLEEQLVELDRIGAHIGAAHLDAAIQHLRLEQAQRIATWADVIP